MPTAPSQPQAPSSQPSSPSSPTPPSRPTEWNPATQGIPKFVTHQYLDLDSIGRISRFRSGEGHSYTDDFERCRSMKHYFDPRTAGIASSIRVYSPVTGTVAEARPEWTGTQVRITPTEYPAFQIILFHVNVSIPLDTGTPLVAGQQIGYHVGSQTMSDVAVGVGTAAGFQLVSWFEVLIDTALEPYRARGISAASDVIISRPDRDSQPLSCSGEQFGDKGTIPNWVNLR